MLQRKKGDKRLEAPIKETYLIDKKEKTLKLSNLVKKFLPFLGLFLLTIFFSITSEHFLTTNNLLTVALQTSIIALIAIGQTFVIIKAGIDLSVGSVVALSGVVVAQSMLAGMPMVVAILIGLAIGTFCGLINGVLIAMGNLSPFITTLGMMGMARGIALVITDGIPVSGLPEGFSWIGSYRFLGIIPLPVMILIAFIVIASIILRKSRFGRNLYAIGSNEEAAFLSGIKVKLNKIYAYSFSGFMAGLVGVILTSRLISAQPTAGALYELNSIAAVVIGGGSLMGGVGTIGGTVIGSFIMGVLDNGLNLLGVSSFWQQFSVGAVVILAVYLDQLRRKNN